MVPHADYRSKAEDRRRELEKLQEKGLTKAKASRLRDASAPTEACNFLEKQRELFAARRQKQVDAIELLHQYRADDELVLRKAEAARRSLGSRSYKFSARHNVTNGMSLSPSKLGREWQPDAKSSLHSYAIYPTLTPTKNKSDIVMKDTISKDSHRTRSHDVPANIDQKPICFESAFEVLGIIAKEASRIPLPEETDEFGYKTFQTTDPLVGITDQGMRFGDNERSNEKDDSILHSTEEAESNRVNGNQNSHGDYLNQNEESDELEKIENESDHSILIISSEMGADVHTEEKRDSRVPLMEKLSLDANPPSDGTEEFIPFEAFSKLGESLVMESLSSNYSRGDNDSNSLTQVETDDDSIIPGDSFMQLGASMMANDLICSKVENGQIDNNKRELLQCSRVQYGVTSTRRIVEVEKKLGARPSPLRVDTDICIQRSVCASKDTTCQEKKSQNIQLGMLKPAAEDSCLNSKQSMDQLEACSSEVKKQEHDEPYLRFENMHKMVESEIVKTPKKSNLAEERSCNVERKDIAHRNSTEEMPQSSRIEVNEGKIQMSANEELNAVDPKKSSEEEIKESGCVGNAKETSQGDDYEELNMIDQFGDHKGTSRNSSGKESSVGSENEELRDKDRRIDDESSATDRTSLVEDVSKERKHEEAVDARKMMTAEESPPSNDNEDANAFDPISNVKEKPEESEHRSGENTDTRPLLVRDEVRRSRQNRRKKKKDKYNYYPSSGLFFSRQFLSR